MNALFAKDSRDLRRPLLMSLFFGGLAILCWKLYPDYGPHWDEKTCQSYGMDTWNYIFNKDPKIFSNPDLDHGPFVEMFLVLVQKCLSAQSWREVVLARHAANVTLFIAAVAAFYRIGLKYFGRWQTALMGCLLLVTSPRIFAEAFYNSKDIGFMSMFVIAIYTLERYRQSRTWFRALTHAALTGACIATRLPGILMLLITLIVEAAGVAGEPSGRAGRAMRLAFYLGMSLVCTLIFWPALWQDPFHSFVYFFQDMESYTQGPWGVVFEGRFVPRPQIPLRYLFQWIMITTPIPFLMLGLAGCTAWAVRIKLTPLRVIIGSPAFIVGLWLAIPLAHYCIRHPNIYDGWRHYYFLYPAMVLCMLKGWEMLKYVLGERRFLILAAAVIIVLEPVWFVIKAHPNEQVYFNFMAGPKHELHKRYDMDYWGLSYRHGLEYILDKDDRNNIVVFANDEPGWLSHRFLLPEDARRIRMVEKVDGADYILTVFRKLGSDSISLTKPPPGFVRDVMIQANGITTLAVYQRRSKPDGRVDESGA